MHLQTFAASQPFSLIILLFLAISLPTNSQEFSTELFKREMGRSERLTHLHFYLHEALRGDATAVVVAQAATTYTYRYRFGEVLVFDDRLTEGPNLSSRVVGRAQGMYAHADVEELGQLMAFNYVFTEGRFNGSTLSVLGRDTPLSAEREMSVVGGSNVFQFARGYVRMREYLDDLDRGVVVDEHDLYVLRY
ncbi:dirigent protein 1-like [Salvia divinorum]|uniref:Dirigent protein n=1 Tax=Salvia divinorum TaxID=28513 RepID=A0ABD1HH11_SALDI